MKNVYFLICLGLVLCLLSGCQRNTETPPTNTVLANVGKQSFVETATYDSVESKSTTVYICKSKGAKKYHYKEFCRGLSNCKHEVVKIEKKDAENRGLGLCGWED